jgi:hypothetical protein
MTVEPIAAGGERRAIRPALRLLRAELPAELRGRLASGRELVRARREEGCQGEIFATGVPALDRLLGGGLVRGRLVELVGRRSSGRFSAVVAALAAATAAGEAAALIDLGDGLDPQTAAAMGADLERLLWVRPRTVGEALAAAEAALHGGFPLVVVELGDPPLAGGRGAEAGWLRLARAARARGAALLVASPYRVSGTAAAAVVAARRGRAVWLGGGGAPRLLAGLAGRLALEKDRGRADGEGDETELRLAAPEAIGRPFDAAGGGAVEKPSAAPVALAATA